MLLFRDGFSDPCTHETHFPRGTGSEARPPFFEIPESPDKERGQRDYNINQQECLIGGSKIAAHGLDSIEAGNPKSGEPAARKQQRSRSAHSNGQAGSKRNRWSRNQRFTIRSQLQQKVYDSLKIRALICCPSASKFGHPHAQ
jgi:hypothetical protein